MRCVGALSNLTYPQLYEEDARIGHREFDLKLTQRVKMSMVCRFLVIHHLVFIGKFCRLVFLRHPSISGLRKCYFEEAHNC